MPVFSFSFNIQAPLADVAAFHHNTQALKRLTPPPIIVQLHHVDPLGEGSVSDFTLWFGPLPVRWQAVHSHVDPTHGFTDTQTRGPLQQWVHTHTFEDIGNNVTRIREHIEYEHYAGVKGVLSRLLFFKPGLYLLFTYRKFVTRRALEK